MSWFSTRADFSPQRYLAMSGDISGCHRGSGTGTPWVEARTASPNNYPAQSVNSARAETPCSRNWWQNIHLSLHSYIHLHLALFLPPSLPQSPLQAPTSTMLPWEPECSENGRVIPH